MVERKTENLEAISSILISGIITNARVLVFILSLYVIQNCILEPHQVIWLDEFFKAILVMILFPGAIIYLMVIMQDPFLCYEFDNAVEGVFFDILNIIYEMISEYIMLIKWIILIINKFLDRNKKIKQILLFLLDKFNNLKKEFIFYIKFYIKIYGKIHIKYFFFIFFFLFIDFFKLWGFFFLWNVLINILKIINFLKNKVNFYNFFKEFYIILYIFFFYIFNFLFKLILKLQKLYFFINFFFLKNYKLIFFFFIFIFIYLLYN